MSAPTWVKLFYQTLESDFWEDSDEPYDWRSAFIYVLLKANWRYGVSRSHGHTIGVNRGQWLTSIRGLMKKFKWSRTRVEHWLNGMEKYGMLSAENVKFGTVLTVVNYDEYQVYTAKGEHTGEHKPEHTEEHDGEHTGEHKGEPRSKKIEERREKEENISPAPAGTPPADKPEPPIGSKEWYALHYDD